MERTLFNKHGAAIAYISDDYNETIYLPDGHPVAYLYEDRHIYGINGRHLGWFVDEVIFDHNGKRIGFTERTCPVAPGSAPVKAEKYIRDEIRPRWAAPAFPNLSFDLAEQDLAPFFKEGEQPRQLSASPLTQH
jgi:hypothetical protein